MTQAASLQQAFADALFGRAGRSHADVDAWVAQPAFAVYRNTVMKACIDALAANFPAVQRLVGEDWFRAVAALHVADDPPQDGRLLVYGAGFPDFLARFEPAASLPYLPGVARLDALWREAHAAADAEVLAPDALAGLPPHALGALRLRPHPAARWACFDVHPVFAIWQRNRDTTETEADAPLDWQGDGGLLTRPLDAVHAETLCHGGCALLDACAAGATLGEAAEGALAARPDTDLAGVLAQLLRAGVFLPLSAP
jgi:hypothetical protein